MKLQLSILGLLFIAVLFTGQEAMAHKINIFAKSKNGRIHAEAFFSGGRPAKYADIRVVAANAPEENLLLTGSTDERGMFSFQPTEKMHKEKADLDIIVQTVDGHKNSWHLPFSDYGENQGVSTSSSPEKRPEKGPPITRIILGLGILFGFAFGIQRFRKNKRRENHEI